MGRKVIIDVEEAKEELEEYRYEFPTYAEQKTTNIMLDIFINTIDSYADEGEEVKIGKWTENKKFNKKNKLFLNCSVCHYGENGDIICEVSKLPNFCPNCGARMNEGSEEE